VSRKEAVEFVSTNLEELFGFEKGEGEKREWVAWEVRLFFPSSLERKRLTFRFLDFSPLTKQRDPFEFGSRQVAASTIDGKVKLFL
jgi:hypothetical protein